MTKAKFFVVIYLILSILLTIINYNFNIYLKGFNSDYEFISKLYFITSYILLPTIGLIFFNEIIKDNTKWVFFLLLFLIIERFLFFTFINSRELIIIYIIYFYSFLQIKQKIKIDIIFLILLACILSYKNVTFLKDYRYYTNKNNSLSIKEYIMHIDKDHLIKNEFKKNHFIKKENLDNIDHILSMTFTRWVGIEGLYLFIKRDGASFFEKENNKQLLNKKIKKNDNFTPGLVASLYKYNSILFLIFSSIILISYLFFLNRYLDVNLKNKFITNFLSYIVIYRLIHMGLNFQTTFLICIIILLFSIFLNKFYKNFLQ